MSFATLVCITALAQAGPATAQPAPPPASSNDRGEDKAAIQKALASFVKAFESGAAKTVADHWTDEGEYESDDVGTVHGRAKLESAFAEFFAKSPKAKAEARVESLRFLGKGSAIVEGLVNIVGSEGPHAAHFGALYVREGDQWRLAHLREVPIEQGSLHDLDWLVGEWDSKGPGPGVVTSYAWNETKTFLNVKFTLKTEDKSVTGTQVIGRDPTTGDVRAWTFEASGGIGNAVWSHDGESWIAQLEATMPDGSQVLSTNVLTKVDDDAFTWQSIERSRDGEPLEDLPPVKVTRRKAK